MMRPESSRAPRFGARAVLALAVVIGVALPACARAGSALVNGSFDQAGSGIPGWSIEGASYGTAEVVAGSSTSAPNALHVTIGASGSTGSNSIMVFQVIADRASIAGKQVTYGARVRSAGAAVNLVLFTPEGSSNDFDPTTTTDGFAARSSTFVIPANASMLSFGIQVFGPPGGQVWVDDAFVEQAGGAATPAPTATPSGATASARVQLDATRSDRNLSPLLFGMHIEWVENGLGLMDPQQATLRQPVVDLLSPLKIPLVRFPGGIHADYYDWKLGDGDPAKRGSSLNVFTGKQEVNRFGTPEYLALLKALGADSLITANYGTGTAAMAGAWADRFAAAGVAPRYWEVGNEIYLSGAHATGPNGSAIFHTPKQYAADFPAYRAAIQKALPQAKVGAIAHLDTGAFPLAPAENKDWTTKMLAALNTRADFLAVHDAYAPVILSDSIDFTSDSGRRQAYQAMYAAAMQTRANLDDVSATATRLSPVNANLPIAVTEFGPFFGATQDPDRNIAYVDQTRTLASAIYVASILDVLIGDPRVFMAAYTNPIHPYYGSLVTDTPSGLVKTPTYYLYEMVRKRFESRLISTDVVTSPSFGSTEVGIAKAHDAVPDLVAKASTSADGKRLTVLLVNRSLDHALSTSIEAKGFTANGADCQVLTAPTANAINGPALGKTVVAGGPEIRPQPLACTAGNTIELTLPPSSIASVVANG